MKKVLKRYTLDTCEYSIRGDNSGKFINIIEYKLDIEKKIKKYVLRYGYKK